MGKLLIRSLILLLPLLIVARPAVALAFGGSEKEEMREDVREALNRARDFNAQKTREVTENLEREKGASEVKKERAEFEAEQEKLRNEYVKERNARPSEFLNQAKNERVFDEQKIIEEREMDKSRERYARDQRKVQRIIDRKAHIDESQEYGL